jgi:hypothetical protein
MCSTSRIVPVRWLAGMLSARAMPGGSAAASTGEPISLRNVRRLLLVMTETSIRSRRTPGLYQRHV